MDYGFTLSLTILEQISLGKQRNSEGLGRNCKSEGKRDDQRAIPYIPRITGRVQRKKQFSEH